MEKNNILTKFTDFFNNLSGSNRIMIYIAGVIILILIVILILMKLSKKQNKGYQPPEPQNTNVHLSELLKQLNDGTNNPKPNITNVMNNMTPDNVNRNNYNNQVQEQVNIPTDFEDKKPFTKVQANINIEINLNNEQEDVKKGEIIDNSIDINKEMVSSDIPKNTNFNNQNIPMNMINSNIRDEQFEQSSYSTQDREIDNMKQSSTYDYKPSIEDNKTKRMPVEQVYKKEELEEKHEVISENVPESTNKNNEDTSENNMGLPQFNFDYFNHFLEENNNKQEETIKSEGNNKNINNIETEKTPIDKMQNNNEFIESKKNISSYNVEQVPNVDSRSTYSTNDKNIAKNNVVEEYNKNNPQTYNQQPQQKPQPTQPQQPYPNNTNTSSVNGYEKQNSKNSVSNNNREYGNGNNMNNVVNSNNMNNGNNINNVNIQHNNMPNQPNIPNQNQQPISNGSNNGNGQGDNNINLGDYFKQYTGNEGQVRPKDERHFARLDDEDYVMSILKKKI